MFFTCAPTCNDPNHKHHAAATKTSPNARISIPARPAAKKTSAGKAAVQAPRIDIHCHYFNPEVGKKAAFLNPVELEVGHIFANQLTRDVNAKQMKDRSPKLSNIAVRIKDMDRMGIDIQAVSPAPFQYYYFAEPDFGAELASDVNNGIADIVAQHPDRFLGLGTVPLQNAELAIKELNRAVKELGLRGIEINTHVNGKNLTDPSLGLEPFFSRVQELGVALFMHPNGFTEAQRLTNHYFNNVIGNPLETTIAASHLIFDGVMARNPKLKVILAHGGGYLAHYWARMDHAHRARPDLKTVIKKKPSSYLERFYFDTITFDPDMLGHLIQRFGADHVLLGTDYPYDMGEVDPLGLIASVKKLSKADKALIQGGNAQNVLRVTPVKKK
jgi:aminocarboxymuconate-semialdehyde decarboxylase